jgi:hypothetical protein
MGNGVSKCLSSGSAAITPKKSTDIEEKQLKVGVVKEENIILKLIADQEIYRTAIHI